jgi:hypothetical protein
MTQQLNAAVRLVADAKQKIAEDVQAGKYQIVDFHDQPYQVVKFKNGRFGVVRRDGPSGSPVVSAGQDEAGARKSAEHANKTGRWNAAV